MADLRDHDAPIWAITMGGIRTASAALVGFEIALIRCTPAMAAGVTSTVWSIEELFDAALGQTESR
jgi:hypothetical protein